VTPARTSRPGLPYSGTPLPKKLGIKEGTRLALVAAPGGFLESTLSPLPDQVELRARVRGPLDVIVFFTKSRADLERRFAKLAAALQPAGALWIAWPKRSSGIETDLTEDVLREVGLPQGLVDNKVCAIDETWSGLRFVIRKENR
jgi:hypothetical protein